MPSRATIRQAHRQLQEWYLLVERPAWSIQAVTRIARTAEGAVERRPEANQEGPRTLPDGGPLRGRALLQVGAAVPGDDWSRQFLAEEEVDGRKKRRITSELCIGT